MAEPRVTVLMPVYDGERYLKEAIDSILRQTWRDLELLVIDDGSRDRSASIAGSCRDARLRLHKNPRNMGIVATLNAGLDLARGEYVARMDADDIAHRDRLARQVRYLDVHPEVAALGTGLRNFGEVRSSWTLKHDPPAVRARLLFECAVSHPTVMLRPEVLRRLGVRYDPLYPHAEDWALWVVLAQHAAVANLPERLLRYRTHARQVSNVENAGQLRSIRKIHAFQLAHLGIDASDVELDLHQQIASGVFQASPDFLDRADAWLRRLADHASRALSRADAAAAAAEASFRWARVCRRSRGLGLRALRRFQASPLHRAAGTARTLEVAVGALAGTIAPRRAAR